MEIEYSNEVKGKIHAYRFDKYEKTTIAKALTLEVKQLEKKRKKVEMHPKNEGQVTFQVQIRDIDSDIRQLQVIIKEFNK